MIPALVGRISFTGELGYEIWVTSEYQRALYDAAPGCRAAHGLRLFGGRALNTLRIEKSFGTWAREYRPIYGPYEAGLGRFVDLQQGRFRRPRGGSSKRSDSGGKLRLCHLQRRCGRCRCASAMSRSGTTAGWSAG